MSVADDPLSHAEGTNREEGGTATDAQPHPSWEPGSKFYEAELTAYFNQPWAATTAFQQMWEQAKLCGLDSSGPTYITLKMEVDGITTPEQVAELAARLEMLRLGVLRVARERELKHE